MVADTGKALGAGALRPVNAPRPARVRVDAGGWPAAVSAGDRWRRVLQVRERWRIDDEWWRERPISRMYHEVILETGKAVVVFHNLGDGGWFVHRR